MLTFTAPWEKLSAESTELAALHGQFSLRISNEIERPLRDYARINSEWQNLPLAETNCNRIAKEFDEKQAKVTKYTRAVEKVSGKKAETAEQKLMDYTKQLESTRTAWRLEGPIVLQKYQSVDQSRLEHLKQVITTFEAIQTETVLQVAEMSGRTSSSVAEFDPLMDMELFASEVSVNMHYRSVPHSKAGSVDHTKTVDTMEHVRSGSTSVLGSALDIPTNHIDAEGFSIPPPDHGPWSDAGMSSNYDDERSETSRCGENSAQRNIVVVDLSLGQIAARQPNPYLYLLSFSQAPKMQLEIRQDSVAESNDEARAALERVTSTLKQTKTVSRRHPGRREVRSMYQSEDSPSAYNSYQSSPLSSGFTDATRDAASTPPSMHSPSSRLFFNNSASHLQANPAFSPASRASALGFPSAPSPLQTAQPSQSMPPTPPLTLVNGSGSGLSPNLAPPMSILGDQQLLSTEPESLPVSSADFGGSAPSSPVTSVAPVPPTGLVSDDTRKSGTNGTVDVPRPGQKQTWVASVVEKIHAHTQAGEISKMMVTGEVVLTLEGTEIDREHQAEKKALLRLDNLQTLEKCIPNPAYLMPKDGTEGTYWVNLESLSQAIQQQQQQQQQGQGHGHGHGMAVLKYQVKTTEEDTKQKTMIPLLVHPAWKCEAHQTSLLINYKANAYCKLSEPTTTSGDLENVPTAQLTELSFLVPVSGEVTNVQSRPTGIWNSESNKMFWDVDNVVMKSTPEPHKLLARFELNSGSGLGPSHPSAAAVKFRVQGRLLSGLSVSMEKDVAEEEKEHATFGSVRLQVQSGRYLAMA
ncbi:hypothetical protein BGX28_006983 [Mortierella sp. GBA30]|nr:hypothetical protein BGX28_006983 [Mortierella sp. GBA30]